MLHLIELSLFLYRPSLFVEIRAMAKLVSVDAVVAGLGA